MRNKLNLGCTDVMLLARKRRFEAFIELQDLLIIEELCRKFHKSKSEILREIIDNAKESGAFAEILRGD